MKHRIQRLTCGLALLMWAAAPLASMSAPAHTGIGGQTFIYRGPVFPDPGGVFPGPIGQPIVRHFPVATSFTVLAERSGRVLAEVTTDANGDFFIALHPGRYIIVPADLPDTLFCSHETPEPFDVTVRPRQVSGAGFTYITDCHGIIGTPAP